MLVVPIDHHLAARSSVSPDDFMGDDSLICPHGGVRSLYPDSAAQEVESFEDRLELIATGQAIAVLPAGDRRSSLRADLATVPVEGMPASRVMIASRGGDPNPLVADFVEVAHAQLGPTP